MNYKNKETIKQILVEPNMKQVHLTLILTLSTGAFAAYKQQPHLDLELITLKFSMQN